MISSQMPYLDIKVGNSHGAFVLDYGAEGSGIDLSAFGSAVPAGCDSKATDGECSVDQFAFFPSPVKLKAQDYQSVKGQFPQAGLIGTDLTTLRSITIVYDRKQLFAAPQDVACDSKTLEAAGLTPLDSRGYFRSDFSKLYRYSVIDPTTPNTSWHVPAVPTVPLRIAGTAAVAQLDTGYDDSSARFSVNINEAFFAKIIGSDPKALVRVPSRDIKLSTCVKGFVEPIEAYQLASGKSLEFIGDTGSVVRTYPGASVFVKRTPAEAQTCGGIGTWKVPAAQIGASYFSDFGTVVFDPFTGLVWIPD